ncbi:hypothetical protein ABRY23_06225 [Melioribacteraceae bacterium 4301-Me]|uniref:hypothetical protein n=1 Tax=Pyranulibacter aquaticus TaxID=3163344 RepID=UPI00359692A8
MVGTILCLVLLYSLRSFAMTARGLFIFSGGHKNTGSNNIRITVVARELIALFIKATEAISNERKMVELFCWRLIPYTANRQIFTMNSFLIIL